ncbi:pantoate--beta-alanine ligase [Mucilaginibacter sp.]
MDIFTTIHEVRQHLQRLQAAGSTIGLVPTMGALHQGHLSLIARSRQQTAVTVCSIFVNPTQFTNAADLEKYPRPIEADVEKLEQAGCDVLFKPPVAEMYDGNEQWHLDIGPLEHLLEGKFRPGHYQGVTQVVYKLFAIVKPDLAFFGQKDYQQVLVIRRMSELLNLPVKLVMCPIERETDGLAMSSRNVHLSADDHRHALVLHKALTYIKDNYQPENLAALQQYAEQLITAEPGVTLDYFELADADTLQRAGSVTPHVVALTAAQVGSTRLIDNEMIS